MSVSSYPDYHKELNALYGELAKEMPDLSKELSAVHKAAMGDGELDKVTKELIALGIGIADRCTGCIAYHVSGALKAGASRAAIIETIGVAQQMGGGPSIIYGCEAFKALQQFEKNSI